MAGREISARQIEDAVERLVVQANCFLPKDVYKAISDAEAGETSPIGKKILGILVENADLSHEDELPICQDTGVAVVFCDIGQDVHIIDGSFEGAVNEGIRRGYIGGGMRLSIVEPLRRTNTGTNTPAVLYTRIVDGDRIKITVCPKGFGSENMSSVRMFNPTATHEEIEQFIVDSVIAAGSNPCPPVIVGIGLGGTLDSAAVASKRVLLSPVDEHNADPLYAEMEQRVLIAINSSNTGPMGLGGRTSALAVRISPIPTHIAGLPCVVNISCHALRHAEATL